MNTYAEKPNGTRIPWTVTRGNFLCGLCLAVVQQGESAAEFHGMTVHENCGHHARAAAAALGRLGGAATAGISTPAKRRAARRNGKRGGRPPVRKSTA